MDIVVCHHADAIFAFGNISFVSKIIAQSTFLTEIVLNLIFYSHSHTFPPNSRPKGVVELAYQLIPNTTMQATPRAFEDERTAQKYVGRAMVVLHGLFGSGMNWRSVSRSLAVQINTPMFLMDLRNHGGSPHTGMKSLY